MKIAYVCQWDKIKEKTWSGTVYSLYKSLLKKIEIKDYDIKQNKVQKIISLLFSLRIFKENKINNRFSVKSYKINNNIMNKKLEDVKQDIVLQIGDFGECSNKYYIYQDLSLDSLLYFQKNYPELFKYSGFQNENYSDMLSRRNVQNLCYEKCSGIFTMSKWLAENLVNYSKIPKEKVHHVGGGINIDINKIETVKKSNNKILFIGRDFFRKGGDLVYNAFKLARKIKPDIKLYVAGPKEWPMKDKDENVVFLGDVNSAELSKYYNMCDIFCMPSRFEAYGLVFIEALVYGLPCIGRNALAMKEFIQDGENGYLIDQDDEDILSSKMLALLTNNEIKANVINKRNEYINEYSWDTVANRIIEVIKNNRWGK